jgi:hypothetical protein
MGHVSTVGTSIVAFLAVLDPALVIDTSLVGIIDGSCTGELSHYS